jgi:hypothetical protein
VCCANVRPAAAIAKPCSASIVRNVANTSLTGQEQRPNERDDDKIMVARSLRVRDQLLFVEQSGQRDMP